MSRMALAALIDDTESRNGWSDRRVVRQAAERGHRLLPTNVSDYRKVGMRTIVPAKIVALAAGLRVPPHVVVRAVMADKGIEIPEDATTPEDAIRRDYTLSERTRDNLLLLIASERERLD